MIDTGAPAAPAESAPATPATEEKAEPKAEAKTETPAIDPTDAAKALRARRAEIREKLKAKPADKEKPAEAKTEAKEAAPKAEAKQEPSTDEVQALIREERRLKAEKAQVAQEREALKAHEPKIKRLEQAESLLAKGDRVGAVRAMFPDLTDDLFWDLAKSIGEKGDAGDAPDIDTLLEQKLTARQEQEARAAQERADRERAEHQAQLARVDEKVAPGFSNTVLSLLSIEREPPEVQRQVAEAYGEFVEATAKVYTAHKDKLPGISEFGASPAEVVRKAEQLRASLKRQPSTAEVLNAIEADITARIERIRPTPTPPQQRPSTAVTNGWRSDPGKPAVDRSTMTLDQIREERRAALRARTS